MPTFDQVDINSVNFGVIQDDISNKFPENVDIGDGWFIGTPTVEEVSKISSEFRKLWAINSLPLPPHEMKLKKTKHGISLSTERDIKAWRYRVVRPTKEGGQKSTLSGAKLAEALRVCESDILLERWSIQNSENENKIGGNLGLCIPRSRKFTTNYSPKTIDTHDFREVVKLRANLNESEFPAIAVALNRFRNLDGHPDNDLKMLGYFGVLEAVLSHAPRPNDPADSITRQLKRNLILLDNRMPDGRKLDILSQTGAKRDKIIGKMYEYRSSIAHGGDPKASMDWLFDNLYSEPRPPMPLLPNIKARWIRVFIRTIIRRVLRQAMAEPQLVSDLK